MEILEAFDLTGSYRDAAELAGCSAHTVAGYVQRREEGRLSSSPLRRDQMIDDYLDKLEEWMGVLARKDPADVRPRQAGRALGYEGSERTTRRVVAMAKKSYRAGRRQAVPPVGARAGHVVPVRLVRRADGGRCATWLLLRVALPGPAFVSCCRLTDKTIPTLISCIDTCLSTLRGRAHLRPHRQRAHRDDRPPSPRIPVRHPELVAMGRHYGLTIATCVHRPTPSQRAARRRPCGWPRRPRSEQGQPAS